MSEISDIRELRRLLAELTERVSALEQKTQPLNVYGAHSVTVRPASPGEIKRLLDGMKKP